MLNSYLYELEYLLLTPSYFTQVHFSPLGTFRCLVFLVLQIIIV